MKKAKPFHSKNFTLIIERAIKQLKNGESRLAVSTYSLNRICLSEFSAPDISEGLSSNYSMPSNNKSVESDYFEEITTIEKLMKEADIPINLADWQSRTTIKSAERMYEGMNRWAYAIQIWDWYAIPWRYKDNSIHLIWSSQDIMGTPIIHSYPVKYFLTSLTNKLENQIQHQNKLQKQLSFWKNFGIILSIIITIFLLARFS